MLIDIDNIQQMLSHVILQNRELVETLASTDQWKDSSELNAKLTVNGIEVPAELLEQTLHNIANQFERNIRDKYNADNLDALVEERALKLLDEHADQVLEKLGYINEQIENVRNVLVPHWDR